MRFGNALRLGLALSTMLLAGTAARADFSVQFTTIGSFSGGDNPGGDTYSDAANGISIAFTSSINNAVTVPPASQVSFGTFDTSATTATSFATVMTDFTLTIFESNPDVGGPLTFLGSVSGTLRIDNSQAYVQFTGPLTQSIGDIAYTIISSDMNTPGRVNLAPPTTNGGLATITGQVGTVPEPSALGMVALGGMGLLATRYRRKRSVATV